MGTDSTFSIDTGSVSELGSSIATEASNYKTNLDLISSTIDGLNAIWTGPTYDAFKAAYYEKLGSLEELHTVISQMADSVTETATNADKVISDVANSY